MEYVSPEIKTPEVFAAAQALGRYGFLTADTAFLLCTLDFSGSYGYFNRANISAGSSDTPSLLCTNVQGWCTIPNVVLTQRVKKCSYGLLTKHGSIERIRQADIQTDIPTDQVEPHKLHRVDVLTLS